MQSPSQWTRRCRAASPRVPQATLAAPVVGSCSRGQHGPAPRHPLQAAALRCQWQTSWTNQRATHTGRTIKRKPPGADQDTAAQTMQSLQDAAAWVALESPRNRRDRHWRAEASYCIGQPAAVVESRRSSLPPIHGGFSRKRVVCEEEGVAVAHLRDGVDGNRFWVGTRGLRHRCGRPEAGCCCGCGRRGCRLSRASCCPCRGAWTAS